MKIAILSRHRTVSGGAESYLLTLIPHLQQRGHELLFLWEFDSGDTSEAPLDQRFEIPGQSLRDESHLSALHKFSPNVVFSQGLQNPNLDQVIARRYPSVLYAHDFFSTCVSGTKSWRDAPGIPCSRNLSPRCLVDYFLHGCGGHNPFTAASLYFRASQSRRNLDIFRKILVASSFMKSEYSRHTSTDVVTLPYPLTIGLPDFEGPSAPTDSVEILFLSRLTTLKGGLDLIRALEILKSDRSHRFRLHVAGEGPSKTALQQASKNLGVDTVYHGWINTAARKEILKKCHLIAMPSLWPEPFGLSGLEAGAFGIPAVAYRSGGIPDWLRQGINGELATAGTNGPQSLSQAILKVVSDPNKYRDYTKKARQVAEEYTIERHALALTHSFESIFP